MKIKTKKQLNLPQLIEWGFNNPELAKRKIYLTKEHDEIGPYVHFSIDGYGVKTSDSISYKDTFTVEVEEEIDEDTVIPKLVKISSNDLPYIFENRSINHNRHKIIDNAKSYYILNDDLTMTLIWRDGKLVE